MTQPKKQHVGTRLADEIGAQNAHALESVTSLYATMLDLIARGCQIRHASIGPRNPRIEIAPPPDGILGAGLKTRRILPGGGSINVHVAAHNGIQIQWRTYTCH